MTKRRAFKRWIAGLSALVMLLTRLNLTDRLEIALGNRTLAVEVLQVAETVKKDDACGMYKEL